MFSCKFKYVSADRLAMVYSGQQYMLDRSKLFNLVDYDWQWKIAKRIKAGIADNRPIMLTREEFCYVSRCKARLTF